MRALFMLANGVQLGSQYGSAPSWHRLGEYAGTPATAADPLAAAAFATGAAVVAAVALTGASGLVAEALFIGAAVKLGLEAPGVMVAGVEVAGGTVEEEFTGGELLLGLDVWGAASVTLSLVWGEVLSGLADDDDAGVAEVEFPLAGG